MMWHGFRRVGYRYGVGLGEGGWSVVRLPFARLIDTFEDAGSICSTTPLEVDRMRARRFRMFHEPKQIAAHT